MHKCFTRCLIVAASVSICAFLGLAAVDHLVFGNRPGHCVREMAIIIVTITVHVSVETVKRSLEARGPRPAEEQDNQ